MASPARSPPNAQQVGSAFVHLYYNIMYQSPGLVYRFYQDTSKLGRTESQGVMTSITTMQAINEKILSMDYAGSRAEIKTVDAQESVNGGLLLLVTGYLTGKDNVRRNFIQSFFLATQDMGYFVLNDIFRYVQDVDQQQGSQGSRCLANESSEPRPLELGVLPAVEGQVPEQSVSPLAEEEEVIEGEVYNPPDNEKDSDEETPVAEVVDEVQDSTQTVVADSGCTAILDEAPKKSYASIVKVKKEAVAPSIPAPVPTKSAPANFERLAAPASTPAPVLEVPAADSNATETSSVQETEADSYSIYIKSLPLNATPAQVEEEFKRDLMLVKVKKEAVAPSIPAPVPTKSAPANSERLAAPAPTPAPVLEVPAADSNATETSSVQETEADSHSIYIKSLPLNATPAQVEEEFKRFGSIKPGGVQVRSQKQQGFCFGFVEFEMASSAQNAIEASPVLIGGRQAFVEEKRPAGSRVSSRGRFPGRLGGFQNERGRGGNYGGGGRGRGYGRGEFNNRTEYGVRNGGRGGGSSSRGGNVGGYRRVDPSGGRGAHSGLVANGGSTKNSVSGVECSLKTSDEMKKEI